MNLEQARFGESFPQGADPKNRMDILKIKSGDEKIPDYVQFGLDVREKLRDQTEKNGWPSLPEAEQIRGVEDIFEAAKSEVSKNWESSVSDFVQKKAAEWQPSLKTEEPEEKIAAEILSNPQELAKSLSLNQLETLEVLRKSNPEAWRTLIMISSERQLAAIAVVEHWMKDENNEQNLENISGKIGLNRHELRLFIDLAAIFGKYIDQGFVKQMELADLPGGSDKTKLGNRKGAAMIYDLYKEPGSQEVSRKTYKEMFPFEWKKIEQRLKDLAVRIEKEVEGNNLPASYHDFAAYLRQAADVYGSENIKPKSLEAEWENLYETAAKLNNTDCPIMLLAQGAASVTGEAGKVDIEMRLGLRTSETRNQEKKFEVFRNIAQEMVDENKDKLEGDYKIPEIIFNYQPYSFGPNLSAVTVGESEKSQILVHANADREIIKERETPLLTRTFGSEQIALDEYLKAVVNENTLHEIGHSVLSTQDEKVNERVGNRFESGILDELKAETVGMKILAEAENQGNLPEGIDLRMQLLAKIGTNLNYLKNKSNKRGGDGEEYYVCGATIIGHLLDKKLIKKEAGEYALGETDSCIKEIASISEEVLSLYVTENSSPKDVKNYINNLRQKAQDPSMQEFISDLRK